MTSIVVSMLVILAVAGAVALYAAYPSRGEQVPGAAWLGQAMERASDALPTIADGELEAAPSDDAAADDARAAGAEPAEQGLVGEHRLLR